MESGKVFFFYIIYSASLDRFYIGHTGDSLISRLKKHNSKHRGFSGRSMDWEVVYTEPYATKQEAYQRERQVKGWKSRVGIERLINLKS